VTSEEPERDKDGGNVCMKGYAALSVIAAALLAAPLADAADIRVSVGLDYSTGDYGEAQDTEITYIPVTGTYQTGLWTAKLTVPYVRITGPGTVLPDIGRVETAPAARRTEEGLGDLVFSLTREVYASAAVLLDVTGKVKIATADEDRDLGTGENDYSLQVDGYVPVGRVSTFGTLGYRILGDPPDFELDNVAFGSLGFSYPISDRLSGGAILDLRERSSPAGHPRNELTLFANSRVTPGWNVQGYVVRGFTDGSPDWGVGLVLVRRGLGDGPGR
jgi:hypothetical protein